MRFEAPGLNCLEQGTTEGQVASIAAIRAVRVISVAVGVSLVLALPTRVGATADEVDELTGLVAAVAFVRPSKNIADVQVSSVKKKWKDRSFAAGANRDSDRRANHYAVTVAKPDSAPDT